MRLLLTLLSLLLGGCAAAPAAPAAAPPAVPPVCWRQESWWRLDVPGELAVVRYDVGELWGPPPFPAPGMWWNPPPPADWLDGACPLCAVVRRPEDGGGAGGGVLTFEEEPPLPPPSYTEHEVLRALREAAGAWPPGTSLTSWGGTVMVTHTAEAHRRLRAWLRPRLCRHDG